MTRQSDPDPHQDERGSQHGAQADQPGLPVLDLAQDLGAAGRLDDRIELDDVPGDDRSRGQVDRASNGDHRFRLGSGQIGRAVDGDDRVDIAGDRRRALDDHDEVGVLAGGDRDVAVGGDQDAIGGRRRVGREGRRRDGQHDDEHRTRDDKDPFHGVDLL